MKLQIKFTQKIVETLIPQSGKTTYFSDSEQPGLTLGVSGAGNHVTRSYYFRRKHKLTPNRFKIGGVHEISLKQARRRTQEILSDLLNGNVPREITKEPLNPVSFGDVMDNYVAFLSESKRKTERQVRNSIHRNIKSLSPKLWKRLASEVGPEDCQSVIRKIIDQGSRYEADKARTYIKTAYNLLLESDPNSRLTAKAAQITINPAQHIKKVSGTSGTAGRIIDLKHLSDLYSYLSQSDEPRNLLLRLYLLTGGQRVSDLAECTVSSVNFNDEYLVLIDDKGGMSRRESPRSHVVPLVQEAIHCIQQLTFEGPYCFSVNGGRSPCDHGYVSKWMKRLSAECFGATSKFGHQDVRTTVESTLIRSPWNVSSDTLKHLLSHGFGGVQDRHYQRYDFFVEKKVALETWREILLKEMS